MTEIKRKGFSGIAAFNWLQEYPGLKRNDYVEI
jgi:hypothetical protein